MLSFNLDPDFVTKYADRPVEYAFGPIGEITYLRSYSLQQEGIKEKWHETCARVTNGVYSIQKDHIQRNHLGWNEEMAQRSAQEFYDRLFQKKFTPPGRGMFAMGTSLVHERFGAAALNNCGFVSTEYIDKEFASPFGWLMLMGMHGVGPGFDTAGKGKIDLHEPRKDIKTYIIPDSREGWAESVEELLNSYFKPNRYTVEFDYSKIRPAGSLIKSFGGKAPGPGPLIKCHERLRKCLDANIGESISSRLIVDICNILGKAIVSGGQRRIAEIAFGDINDVEYISLKDWTLEENRERTGPDGWAHCSNNSIITEVGDDYTYVAKKTAMNGEPGYLWLNNARAYGRMIDPPNWKDKNAKGQNPCNEQTLEHKELCTLVEVYPGRHENLEDFTRTLKFAYLYGKTVTLLNTHDAETNRVMHKNRRIGVGLSGIVQLIDRIGLHESIKWFDIGYKEIQRWDEIYSNWFGIPKSIKTTTVKPSGTVSLVAGVTAGIHYPIGEYYVKRLRLHPEDDLVPVLREQGYHIEPSVMNPEYECIVEIPVYTGLKGKKRSNVTMWEQLNLAAILQRYWSDNAVSITVTFDPETEGSRIKDALEMYQYHLKGVSFLPLDNNIYPQMPEEEITRERYEEMMSRIKSGPNEYKGQAEQEKFCSNDTCTI